MYVRSAGEDLTEGRIGSLGRNPGPGSPDALTHCETSVTVIADIFYPMDASLPSEVDMIFAFGQYSQRFLIDLTLL